MNTSSSYSLCYNIKTILPQCNIYCYLCKIRTKFPSCCITILKERVFIDTITFISYTIFVTAALGVVAVPCSSNVSVLAWTLSCMVVFVTRLSNWAYCLQHLGNKTKSYHDLHINQRNDFGIWIMLKISIHYINT